MAKVKLTAGRIEKFYCEKGKHQDFLWCMDVHGLAVRATEFSNVKSYIFQAKVNKRTMRLTIGKVSAWTIVEAQAEARRLQVDIDKGHDPRKLIMEAEEAKISEKKEKKAANAALELKTKNESVTVGSVWQEYLLDRKPRWSDRHYNDHVKSIQLGGDKRKRSAKLTEPGPLALLSNVRLVDLNTKRINDWAKVEAAKRPTSARLALRLLKAFLFWCAAHETYSAVITSNPAQSKTARESLGKAKVKNDVLQREQLTAWFKAVKQINNPIISVYLQTLLIVGSRREELATLRWIDIDFQWNSITIKDKVEGQRVVPLTPYVSQILQTLPKRDKWVFSSPSSKSGRLIDPSSAHRKACEIAGLEVTLHGLRRSFATLSEWTETPAGIAAQIQGHAPQGVRESNYIRRPLDLLRMWHIKIEAWILEQACINFMPVKLGIKAVL